MMKKLLSGDGEAVGLARTNVYWGGLCNEVGEGDASSFASHCRVVFYGSIKSEPARMLTIFSPEDLMSVCLIDGSSQQNGIGPSSCTSTRARVHRICTRPAGVACMSGAQMR